MKQRRMKWSHGSSMANDIGGRDDVLTKRGQGKKDGVMYWE